MAEEERTNWKFTIEERRDVLKTIDKKEKADGEKLQIVGVMPCLRMYLFNSQNKNELYRELVAYALKEAVYLEDRLSSNVFPDRKYPVKASNSIIEFLGIDRQRYYRWVKIVEGGPIGRRTRYANFLPLLQLYRKAPGVKLASAFRMFQAVWPEFLNYCMHESEVPTRGDVANSSNLIFLYDPQYVNEKQVADDGILAAFMWVKQLSALLRQVVAECDNAKKEPRWRGGEEDDADLHRKFFVYWGFTMFDLPNSKDRIGLVREHQSKGERLVSL